jgi:hypothetical protein
MNVVETTAGETTAAGTGSQESDLSNILIRSAYPSYYRRKTLQVSTLASASKSTIVPLKAQLCL